MKVVSAGSLAEALAALDDATPESRVLAGGTDLMVELEAGRTRPDLVIDVWKLDELRSIREESGGVRIGALATCDQLARSALVARAADILVDAVREVGAVQIRNRATIGGNLGTASPAADLNPALFALGARVRLRSSTGARELAVEEFVTGYRSTARATNELIESVWIPERDPGELRAFRKVGTRRAQSIAKVVAALCVIERDGKIHAVRAAAGSVADRTLRLCALERALSGRAPTLELILHAARETCRADAAPRTDVRSTAEYRRDVLARILVRMLTDLFRIGDAR